MAIDLDALVAIDVHTHAEASVSRPQDPVTGEVLAAAARYFGGHPPQPTTQHVADYYRERRMAVVFSVDDTAGMGQHAGPSGPTTATCTRFYEVIAEAGLIARFHSGQTGIGVSIDLSGWSPNFPPQLVRYTNTLLKENAARLLGLR